MKKCKVNNLSRKYGSSLFSLFKVRVDCIITSIQKRFKKYVLIRNLTGFGVLEKKFK